MLVYLAMIPTEEGRNKFALLYWEYRDLMFYLALRILGSQQDAEDAVQEALLRITEIIEKIHDPVCPETKALVGMIVEGKALDLYRRRRRQGAEPLEDWAPAQAGRPPEEASSLRELTAQAMARLPARQRTVLLLKYDRGLDNREIARVLEVLVQVYEEITNFRFSAEGETDRTAGDFVLTYLPQGMEETVRQSSRIRHYICFEDNAGNMLEVTHIVVGANASSILGVDTEDAEVEYFKIHNSEAMAISKNLDHTIFWTEDNCYYLLSGTIPMEELKQVALGLEPIS